MGNENGIPNSLAARNAFLNSWEERKGLLSLSFLVVKKRFSEFIGGKKRAPFSEFLGGKKRFSEFLGGKKRFSEFLGGKKRFSEFVGGKRDARSVDEIKKRDLDFLGGR